MIDSVALASLFCSAQTIPVVGLNFNPSTRPEIVLLCWTAPLVALYWTIVLLPPAPVESALSPYSTQTEPPPIVTESGCVPPTGPPVAKTDELAVGAACADAPSAIRSAAAEGARMGNGIEGSPFDRW